LITAIIQARTGSKRLPDKIFLDLCNYPLIWHVVNRLRYSKFIDRIILATTSLSGDDGLEEWAYKNGVFCYRGESENVLNRFYEAAKLSNSKIILRVTADDPFKDPYIVDKVIEMFLTKKLDFAYNNHPPTFPEGLDVEVFGFEALEKAEKICDNAFEREHVTQFFYNNPHLFLQENYKNDFDFSALRWTIDYQEDYEMTKLIYEKLFEENKIFATDDILNLLSSNFNIALINKNVKRSLKYCK
jgi:spore coat polysaccharide biosynthesis protein SpsF